MRIQVVLFPQKQEILIHSSHQMHCLAVGCHHASSPCAYGLFCLIRFAIVGDGAKVGSAHGRSLLNGGQLGRLMGGIDAVARRMRALLRVGSDTHPHLVEYFFDWVSSHIR